MSGDIVASATEFSGLAPTNTRDQISSLTGNTMAMTSGTAPATTQAEELLLGAFGTQGDGDMFTAGTNGTLVNCATTVNPTYSTLPSATGASAEIFPGYCIVGAIGSFQAQGSLNNAE